MTREALTEKMKDLPNPPCRVNLIQQVWEIMNSETEELEKKCEDLEIENAQLDNDNLITQDMFAENEKLKAQIEKMKCCGNCANNGEDYYGNGCCKKNKSAWDCDSWEVGK